MFEVSSCVNLYSNSCSRNIELVSLKWQYIKLTWLFEKWNEDWSHFDAYLAKRKEKVVQAVQVLHFFNRNTITFDL